MNTVPGLDHVSCVLVVGLGKTGQSILRYLSAFDVELMATDTQLSIEEQVSFLQTYPGVSAWVDSPNALRSHSIDALVVSPGVKPSTDLLQRSIQEGIPCLSDIALFAAAVTRPIIAITGSNGKTTVTRLVAALLQGAGYSALACGNIGVAALDVLLENEPDYYVCELSSFQLERTPSLHADVAVCLNISPDHLEWHGHMEHYTRAKMRVYESCKTAIIPQGKSWATTENSLSFSASSEADVCVHDGRYYVHGKPLLRIDSTQLLSLHEQDNVCAALACVFACGVSLASIIPALCAFSSLPHRCQEVLFHQGVTWFNDSKATNVASAVAGMASVAKRVSGRLVLIMGGLSKAADLSALREPVRRWAKHVLLLGEDAQRFDHVLSAVVPVTTVSDMQAAVYKAADLVDDGDAVLLAPACASFDMFNGYEHRGDAFCSLASTVAQEGKV